MRSHMIEVVFSINPFMEEILIVLHMYVDAIDRPRSANWRNDRHPAVKNAPKGCPNDFKSFAIHTAD